MRAMTEDKRSSPKPDPFSDEALSLLGRKFRKWARSESYWKSVGETMFAPYKGKALDVEEYAKVARFFASGRFALWLGLITAVEALKRDDLSESEKCLLAKAAMDFEANMSKIIGSSKNSIKNEAIGAILSAIKIGLEAGISNKNVLQKITDALAKERRARVDPAIKARKAEAIDNIIQRLSEDLWTRNPSRKGNCEGILSAFNEELLKWSHNDRPKSWPVIDLKDNKAMRQAIDRIRRRISKVHTRGNG